MDNTNHPHTVPQLIIEDTDTTSSSDSDIEGGTVPTVARQLSRTPSISHGPLSSPLHSHLHHDLGSTVSGSTERYGSLSTGGANMNPTTNTSFLSSNGALSTSYSIGLNGSVNTPSLYHTSSYGFTGNSINTQTNPPNTNISKGFLYSNEPYSPRLLSRSTSSSNSHSHHSNGYMGNTLAPLFTSTVGSSNTPLLSSARTSVLSSSSSSSTSVQPSTSTSGSSSSALLSPSIVTEESYHQPIIHSQKKSSYSTLTSITSTIQSGETDNNTPPTDNETSMEDVNTNNNSAPPISLRIDVASTLKRQESIDPFEALFLPKTPLSLPTRFTTPIHEAVREGQVSTLTRLLSAASQGTGTASGITDTNLVNDPNEYGFTPLMLASAYEGTEEIAESLLSLLLGAGADVHKKDNIGMTALHWATECTIANSKQYLPIHNNDGNPVTTTLSAKPLTLNTPRISILIKYGAKVNNQDNNGDTPLHRACRSGRADAIRALMRAGANPRIANRTYVTPYDVAGHRGDENGTFDFENRKVATETLIEEDPTLRVLVLHHPDCLQHVTWRGHQEAPERVIEIMNYVRDPTRFHSFELNISSDVPLAETDTVISAHTPEYFDLVKRLASHVERLQHSVPFTPQIKRYKRLSVETPEPGVFPSDTTFSAGSFRAALRAAGSVCRAVDAVVKGESRYALCCVRPPGHHAGVEGLILDGESHDSCGFCIFNNVAIGALHAMKTYPNLIKRVAIVDIDVHHGNGTEEIVKRWAEMQRIAKEMQKRINPNSNDIPIITDYHADQSMFFFSVHLFDVTDPSKNRRKNNSDGVNTTANGTTNNTTDTVTGTNVNNVSTNASAVANDAISTGNNVSGNGNQNSTGNSTGGGRSLRPRREILPKKLSMDEDAEMDTINNGSTTVAGTQREGGRRTRPSSRAGPTLTNNNTTTVGVVASGTDYDSGTNNNPQNSGRVSARKKARFTSNTNDNTNEDNNTTNYDSDNNNNNNTSSNDILVSSSQNKIVTTPSRVIDIETDNNAYPIIKGNIGSPYESVPLKPVKYMVSEIKLTNSTGTGRNSNTKNIGQSSSSSSSSSTTPAVQGSRRKLSLTNGSSTKGGNKGTGSTDKQNTSNLNLGSLFSPRLTSPVQLTAGLVMDTSVLSTDERMFDRTTNSTSSTGAINPAHGFRIIGYQSSTLTKPGIPLDEDTKLSIINYIHSYNNSSNYYYTSTTSTIQESISGSKPPTGRKVTLKMDKNKANSSTKNSNNLSIEDMKDTVDNTLSNIVVNNTFMDALLEVAVAEDSTPTATTDTDKPITVASRKRTFNSLTPEPKDKNSTKQNILTPLVEPPPLITRQPVNNGSVIPLPEAYSTVPQNTSGNTIVPPQTNTLLHQSPINHSTNITNDEHGNNTYVFPPKPSPLTIERTSSFSGTGSSTGASASSDPLLHIHPGGISLTPRIQSTRIIPNGSPNSNGVLHSPSQSSSSSFSFNLRRSISAFTLPPSAQSPSVSASSVNRTQPFQNSIENSITVLGSSSLCTSQTKTNYAKGTTTTATNDGVSTVSDHSSNNLSQSVSTSNSLSTESHGPVHNCQHNQQDTSSSQQFIGTLVVAGDAAIAAAQSVSDNNNRSSNVQINDSIKNNNSSNVFNNFSSVPTVIDASSSTVIHSSASLSGSGSTTTVLNSSAVSVSATNNNSITTNATMTTATTMLRPGVIPPPIVTSGPVVPTEEGVYKFYPGSGRYDCMEANIINAPIAPKWKDRKDRRDRNLRDPKKTPFGRLAAQRIIYSRLIPALRAFSPDLIIISSGFDAGKGDAGNRHTRFGYEGMDLLPEDFAWITRQILAIARVCCPGRVISVLEGGYGRMVSAKAAGLTTTSTVPNSSSAAALDSSTFSSSSSIIPNELPSSSSSSSTSTAAPAEDSIVFLRDILAANCSAHLRALVDDGGAFQLEATDMSYQEE